jgi:hypothetical protein
MAVQRSKRRTLSAPRIRKGSRCPAANQVGASEDWLRQTSSRRLAHGRSERGVLGQVRRREGE